MPVNGEAERKPGCFAKLFPCFAASHQAQDRNGGEVAVHADLVRQNQTAAANPVPAQKQSQSLNSHSNGGNLGNGEPAKASILNGNAAGHARGKESGDGHAGSPHQRMSEASEKPAERRMQEEQGQNGTHSEVAEVGRTQHRRLPEAEEGGVTIQSANVPPAGPGATRSTDETASSAPHANAIEPARPQQNHVVPPLDMKPPPHPNRSEHAAASVVRSLGFPSQDGHGEEPQLRTLPAVPVSHSPFQSPRVPMPFVDGEADGADGGQDLGRVLTFDGEVVEARVIELEIEELVDAIHYCMIVSHPTSDELGCLLTLRAAAGSAGLALDHAGLQLASKSGSEAATVMSARQCALFRRGLALELEYVNKRIARHKVQVRRFQVLREDFSVSNGMLDAAGGGVRRDMVQRRYRHIINDMYHHEARYPHRWMHPDTHAPPAPAAEGGRGRGAGSGRSSPREDARRRELAEVAEELERLDAQVARGLQAIGPDALTALGRPFSLDPDASASDPRLAGADAALEEVLGQYADIQNGTVTPRNATPPRHGGARHSPPPQRTPGGLSSAGASKALTPRSPRTAGGGWEGAGGGGDGSMRSRSPRQSPARLPTGFASGHSTPRDRGRYSPSFSYSNVAAYDRSRQADGSTLGPVGVGLMGLPVGGASFQGLVEGCMPNNPGASHSGMRGRPPRPQAYAQVHGAGSGAPGGGGPGGGGLDQPWAAPGQQGRNAMRGSSPAGQAGVGRMGASPQRGRPEGGEWAF